MIVSTIGHESLFGRLSSGLTLVTGNSRLARVLNNQYSQWRINQGDTQWQSPAIHSWDVWLGRLLEAASLQGIEETSRAVPGSQQLVSLWENVLRDDPHAQQLLRPESLATRLRDTRRLLVEWRLDPSHPAWLGDENENYSAFYRWNRAFEALCQQNHWIAPEDRSALLGEALQNEQLLKSANLGLLGFDEFNPGQLELLAALIETGNSVTRLAMTPADSDTA